LTSAEITDVDFAVEEADHARYTYDLANKKLSLAASHVGSNSYIDYDLDKTPKTFSDYAATQATTINGQPVTYVPVPLKGEGLFRIYVTAESKKKYEKLPATFATLSNDILHYPEWNELLIRPVEGTTPILANDESTIAKDVKSLDSSTVIQIPNKLFSLSAGRLKKTAAWTICALLFTIIGLVLM
jgi:hypothetical protein